MSEFVCLRVAGAIVNLPDAVLMELDTENQHGYNGYNSLLPSIETGI